MPTERRHPRDGQGAPRPHRMPGDRPDRKTEILPLYARLSMPGAAAGLPAARRTGGSSSPRTWPNRRSPCRGIRYVIDPGTARISRYSPRSKTQRLPIEAVSQASADQRKGRCGRVGPGICVRLFSEEDYRHRDRYTRARNPADQPGRRSSCRPRPCGWARSSEFPFLDPPKPRRHPRRLPDALRARRARRAAGTDRDRPAAEPPAGRPADRADDPGRRRGGLPARGADHRRGPGGAGPARAAAGKARGGRRRPTPSSPTRSPTSSAT